MLVKNIAIRAIVMVSRGGEPAGSAARRADSPQPCQRQHEAMG
jgi:hypothetical protein